MGLGEHGTLFQYHDPQEPVEEEDLSDLEHEQVPLPNETEPAAAKSIVADQKRFNEISVAEYFEVIGSLSRFFSDDRVFTRPRPSKSAPSENVPEGTESVQEARGCGRPSKDEKIYKFKPMSTYNFFVQQYMKTPRDDALHGKNQSHWSGALEKFRSLPKEEVEELDATLRYGPLPDTVMWTHIRSVMKQVMERLHWLHDLCGVDFQLVYMEPSPKVKSHAVRKVNMVQTPFFKEYGRLYEQMGCGSYDNWVHVLKSMADIQSELFSVFNRRTSSSSKLQVPELDTLVAQKKKLSAKLKSFLQRMFNNVVPDDSSITSFDWKALEKHMTIENSPVPISNPENMSLTDLQRVWEERNKLVMCFNSKDAVTDNAYDMAPAIPEDLVVRKNVLSDAQKGKYQRDLTLCFRKLWMAFKESLEGYAKVTAAIRAGVLGNKASWLPYEKSTGIFKLHVNTEGLTLADDISLESIESLELKKPEAYSDEDLNLIYSLRHRLSLVPDTAPLPPHHPQSPGRNIRKRRRSTSPFGSTALFMDWDKENRGHVNEATMRQAQQQMAILADMFNRQRGLLEQLKADRAAPELIQSHTHALEGIRQQMAKVQWQALHANAITGQPPSESNSQLPSSSIPSAEYQAEETS